MGLTLQELEQAIWAICYAKINCMSDIGYAELEAIQKKLEAEQERLKQLDEK